MPLGTVVYRDTAAGNRRARPSSGATATARGPDANAAAAVRLAEEEASTGAAAGGGSRYTPATAAACSSGTASGRSTFVSSVDSGSSQMRISVDAVFSVAHGSSIGNADGRTDEEKIFGSNVSDGEGEVDGSGCSGSDASVRGSRAQLDSLPVVADLVAEGQTSVVAAGGAGGRGNATFRNAPNRPASKRHESGEPGECLSQSHRPPPLPSAARGEGWAAAGGWPRAAQRGHGKRDGILQGMRCGDGGAWRSGGMAPFPLGKAFALASHGAEGGGPGG